MLSTMDSFSANRLASANKQCCRHGRYGHGHLDLGSHLATAHQRQQQQQQHQPLQQQLHSSQPSPHIVSASPYYTTDTVTQDAFQETEYESTLQCQQRKAWASAVRGATGRRHHLIWEPELDPPLLLANVTVVLVGPKKPISCGTIARSCSCFEVDDLRVVQPRCQPNTRQVRGLAETTLLVGAT